MDNDLSRMLHTVTALADRAADRILQTEHGLSYRRFLALYAVYELGSCTQRELAERLGLTDPSVSRMVQVLAGSGLLDVAADSGGNRRRLTLTKQGANVVEAAGSELEQRFASLLATAGVSYGTYRDATRKLLIALGGTDSSATGARQSASTAAQGPS